MNGKLQQLREQKALSRRDLSNLSGVDEITIYRLERGKTKKPMPSTIRKLAESLGVKPEYLLSQQRTTGLMNKNPENNTSKLTAISLFTGAGGLDIGFEQEGFDVRVAIDLDPKAIETIKANRPSVTVISNDICKVSTKEILKKARMGVGEVTVLIGAPPCEPFSVAGRRNGFQDDRAKAMHAFIDVINKIKPQFFVLEEVPGFLRVAKRHISFYERVKKRPEELDPDTRLGSAFEEILKDFESTGYKLSYDHSSPKDSILNAADFGVPQKRLRFIMIGSREGKAVPLPVPTHGAPNTVEVISGRRRPWVTLGNALKELCDPSPEYVEFPLSWRPLLALVPQGGCWRDLPDELHKEALGGAYDDAGSGLKGGRTGFLRRLSWDRPSPTVVDRPTTKAGCLCHPDAEPPRPLSVKEYAKIQGFPDNWLLPGPISAKYRLIGQATPVQLSRAVAVAVQNQLASVL